VSLLPPGVRSRAAGIGPRRAALGILGQVREGRPFDAALGREVGELAEPDRRLAHELAAGVLRHRSVLDEQLAPLVSRGWSSVASELQDILRLGAYQLTALERVPAHAAVDTSVALAKDAGGPRAAGFVNAVLRRLSHSDSHEGRKSQGDARTLALEYSHPPWLVRRWVERFGPEQAEALLRWNNARPRLVAQPAREGLDALAARWRAAGIEVETSPYGAGLTPNRSHPVELPGYQEGSFFIQDPAQALLARFADPPSAATVYDACAAPGGKTIALGHRAARIVAGEINRLRARRLAENLARAGSGREHAVVADARQPPVRPVDVVLLDAPCLGTGTFARHPDARWRVTPEALARITQLQAELLDGTAGAVAPGGLLVYSTCSLEPEENLGQVERFLARHPEFQREEVSIVPQSLLSSEGDLVILPQLHRMDGAYAARLRRHR
jgi:16S rRNA (cytosine967-C5)-methyltransferase